MNDGSLLIMHGACPCAVAFGTYILLEHTRHVAEQIAPVHTLELHELTATLPACSFALLVPAQPSLHTQPTPNEPPGPLELTASHELNC